MLHHLRVRILLKNQPFSPPNDFIPNIRIHDLEPPARRILLVPSQLAIPKLDEANAAAVGAEEHVDAVEGGGVGLTFALD